MSDFSDYAAGLEVNNPDKLDRLTTFFRLILIILNRRSRPLEPADLVLRLSVGDRPLSAVQPEVIRSASRMLFGRLGDPRGVAGVLGPVAVPGGRLAALGIHVTGMPHQGDAIFNRADHGAQVATDAF
jgi:hypothetical protein